MAGRDRVPVEVTPIESGFSAYRVTCIPSVRGGYMTLSITVTRGPPAGGTINSVAALATDGDGQLSDWSEAHFSLNDCQ